MFYVPDEEESSRKRASLRIIKRFSELYERINPERKDNHSTIRLKTVEPVVEKQKRNSLPCKSKHNNVCLPIIEEKKFLLKGSELSPARERSESTRKLATKYEKGLKSFKKAGKLSHQNRTAHKMKISFGNMGVHV